MSAKELKSVSIRLSQPPFSKTINAIQLNDDFTHSQLLQLITDVMAYIDNGNPNSPHKTIDIRNEDQEETVIRMYNFLVMLNYTHGQEIVFRQKLLDCDKPFLLSMLCFLLKDEELNKKRAYLSRFLASIPIPHEFTQDEDIKSLLSQVESLQDEFKETHKFIDSARESGNTSLNLKREIKQMEEEKEQITAKLTKLKNKVDTFPKNKQWLETAKNLRAEQNNEINIMNRIRDQKLQIDEIEKQIEKNNHGLKTVKAIFINGGPEALLSKMQEDVKMSKYLATENLPAIHKDISQQIQDLLKVLSEPNITENDLIQLENELKSLNDAHSVLNDQKMIKNAGGDSKVALFRQQASIISSKKDATAMKLSELSEMILVLRKELESKQKSKTTTGVQMLKGDDFKRYVTELRYKSTTYKSKKSDLASLSTENGVLMRTLEILKGKKSVLEKKVKEMEMSRNIVGFHETQEILEKVSEKKTEVDEAKGTTLNEISSIVSNLMTTLAEKKVHLAPIIQNLRSKRQEFQEIESDYMEFKNRYDSIMAGLDSQGLILDKEVKGYQQEIINNQTRYHHLNLLISTLDATNEKVLNEMKSYIGGDSNLEEIQAKRGFKTYRDLYTKKIHEADSYTKTLKEKQKDVKINQERNLHQLGMFLELKKFLQLKVTCNKKILKTQVEIVTEQDRLVIS